jgi:hypothetical protein
LRLQDLVCKSWVLALLALHLDSPAGKDSKDACYIATVARLRIVVVIKRRETKDPFFLVRPWEGLPPYMVQQGLGKVSRMVLICVYT